MVLSLMADARNRVMLVAWIGAESQQDITACAAIIGDG
jgi:hypothetical protein